MPKEDETVYMTTPEVSRALRLSSNSVLRMAREGRLEARMPNQARKKGYRYPAASVRRYAEAERPDLLPRVDRLIAEARERIRLEIEADT